MTKLTSLTLVFCIISTFAYAVEYDPKIMKPSIPMMAPDYVKLMPNYDIIDDSQASSKKRDVEPKQPPMVARSARQYQIHNLMLNLDKLPLYKLVDDKAASPKK